MQKIGGDDGTRTHYLRIANATLYQVSYIPTQGKFCSRKNRLTRPNGKARFEIIQIGPIQLVNRQWIR